ncbi:MAG: hypothetical protein ABEJ80_06155 [Halarchaeum sp.]
MSGADDGEWAVSLDDLESDDGDDGAPLGPPIEPESPSPENVLFFVVGALLALGTFALLLG